MTSASRPRRRYFSDAQRAVDPLLCEEDTSFILQECSESESAGWQTFNWLAGCLFRLAAFVGLTCFMRFGPFELGWLAAIVVSVAVWRLGRWSFERLRMAFKGRFEESDALASGDPILFRESPYLDCGAPAREIVVANYLIASRDSHPWFGVFIAAASIAILAIGPISIAEDQFACVLVVAASLAALLVIVGRVGDVEFDSRVRRTLEQKSSASWLGVEPLRPRGMLEKEVPAHSERGNLAVLTFIGASFVQAAAAPLLQELPQGAGRSMALAWPATLAVWAWRRWHRRAPEIYATRTRQRVWLRYAEILAAVSHAYEDDPSADTVRWASWLFSPHRDPTAPAPELDAKWMASHARE